MSNGPIIEIPRNMYDDFLRFIDEFDAAVIDGTIFNAMSGYNYSCAGLKADILAVYPLKRGNYGEFSDIESDSDFITISEYKCGDIFIKPGGNFAFYVYSELFGDSDDCKNIIKVFISYREDDPYIFARVE